MNLNNLVGHQADMANPYGMKINLNYSPNNANYPGSTKCVALNKCCLY